MAFSPPNQVRRCLLVCAFVATGSIPGLGGDGEVRNMADGGKRLAPEPISRDACQVPELPQLARGEPGDVDDQQLQPDTRSLRTSLPRLPSLPFLCRCHCPGSEAASSHLLAQ